MHRILNPAGPGDLTSRAVDLSIVGLILVSSAAVVLESVEAVQQSAGELLFAIEVVSLVAFTIEYILRIWSITVDPRFRQPVSGRLRYACTPAAIIDLLAILPALLPFVGLDLRVLRLLRVFRLLRVLKLGRYTGAMDIIGAVFRRTREELLVTLAFVGVLILIAATLMHAAEGEAQPEVFGSVPAAVWWAVVTLTTVGYGDAYPITAAGRLIAGVLAVLGVGFVGLPAGILGAGFLTEMNERKARVSGPPSTSD